MNAYNSKLTPRPPVIAPSPAGEQRPRWAVMIPVRNRLDHLEQCLRSVLSQAPDARDMQIEVVDNSTDEVGVSAFVQKTAGERVAYFRQPRDAGMAENWNTCIERARGDLVHILHDDDWVEPHFYQAIDAAAAAHPAAGLLVTRSLIRDAAGNLVALSERAVEYESRSATDPRPLLFSNLFRTPAAVMRRAAVEHCGGFRDFGHVSDWEMWIRLTSAAGCIFINRPLADYRLSDGNLTTVHERSGAAVRDAMRLGDALSHEVPGFDTRRYRVAMAVAAEDRLASYCSSADWSAVRAYAKLWWQAAARLRRCRGAARILLKLFNSWRHE